MKALVYDGVLKFDSNVPVPKLCGEVLIRVHLAGICNTDVEITRGYKGYRGVLGHEFVGEVADAPDHTWIGRRVCGEINTRCGECAYCVLGLDTHCIRRTVLGILNRSGAFAEYLSLPPSNVHMVPDSVADEEAVYIEPLAAAYQILEQVRIVPSDRVIVLGDGKLGLLCAQVLSSTNDDLTLIGRHERKLALARTWGINAQFGEKEAPHGADIVIEATGSATGFDQAMTMVRPRGTVLLKSTTAEPITVDMSIPVVKEITIVGSRCGPFPKAIQALEHGPVQVNPLTEAIYPLARGLEAMEHASTRGSLKILLRIASP